MIESNTKSELKLRLWPGVVIVLLQWCAWYMMTVDFPDNFFSGKKALKLGGLGIIVWWVVFSRATWKARILAPVIALFSLEGVFYTLHPSLSNFGFTMYAIPILSSGFVAWAMMSRGFAKETQHYSMMATILLLCLPWVILRSSGIDGMMRIDLDWRWSKSKEESLLNQSIKQPKNSRSVRLLEGDENAWLGFRGQNRDGKINGVQIEMDWSESPPIKLWERPIGPGWSSFAVSGQFFYTQEQRGEEELVVCYNLNTGEPVWKHSDLERFWESMTGAGPRATPTLFNGKLYTLGATGVLNALDAKSGNVIWSRNAVEEAGKDTPLWGVSSSPLIVDDKVIVSIDGKLVALDLNTGEPIWHGQEGGTSYSSPHLMTIDGVEQVLIVRGPEVVSVSPNDGKVLWKYNKKIRGSYVQPATINGGDLLISDGDTIGIRRISAKNDSGDWIIEEIWKSKALKPYFSDFVVHDGYAFGFNSSVLACINIKDGKRMWKGGRYGSGQLILLADQSVLIVLSERGELALVEAKPDQFSEKGRFPAIEGKTWNHPVLVGDTLLVRNDHEMAAFRISLSEEYSFNE